MSKQKRNYKKKSKSESKSMNAPFKGNSIPYEEDARNIPKPDNDPAWYGVSPQMVKDVASISFNNPAGLPFDLWGEGSFMDNYRKYTVPGIMVLDYSYGPGVSKDKSSAINLAATNFFAFTRHANSGAAPYEVADEFMYFMATSACYVLYMELVRLYGFTLQYKQSNRYYNYSIIEALGFDPVDIERHLPQLRFEINKFARKIGTKPLPNNVNYFKRLTFLPSQIFEDATNKKAQLYIFKPNGYYTYEEILEDDPRDKPYCKWWSRDEIRAEANPSAGAHIRWTIEDIAAVTEFMARKVLDSEDMAIISGDIIKAYGSNVFQLSEISENFMLETYFSEEIMNQIHNTTITGPLSDMDVWQDYDENYGSILMWAPVLENTPGPGESNVSKAVNKCMLDGNHILDMPYDSPIPEDVMVATRLMACFDTGRNPLMMTECVTDVWVITLNNGTPISYGPIYGSYTFDLSQSSVKTLMKISDLVSKFDRHPRINYVLSPNQSTSGIVASDFIQDLYNYTIIGFNELDKMHQTAVLSLWDVPETAFYKSV